MIYEQETNIYQKDAIKDAIDGLDTDIQAVETTLTNGKNKVTFGTSAPSSTTGAVAGDLYYVRGTITNAQGQQVQSCTGVYRFDGSAWQPETMSQGIFGSISADNILTGILKAIRIEGPTSDTFWKLDTGEFQNYGESEVTADVETSEGVETPVTYNCKVKAKIYDGNFYSVGTHSADPDTDYSRIGVAGQGMDYKFYSQLPDGIQNLWTSFVFGQVGLYGDKVKAYGGHTQREEDDPEPDAIEAVNYKPYGEYGPDYIEIGKADGIVNADGTAFPSTHSPDRNILRLTGGWADKQDSIRFVQNYSWYSGGGGSWVREFYNDKPVISRAAWDITPGETIENNGDTSNYVGLLANDKKSIRLTIPLSRPISPDVTEIEFYAYVRGAWCNGTTLSSFGVPDDASATIKGWDAGGVTIWIDKTSAWAGTNNCAVCLQFTTWGMNFY